MGRPFFLFCTCALALGAGTFLVAACSDSPVAPPPPPTPDPLVVACPSPVAQPSTTGQAIAVRYGTPTATGGTPPVQITCTPGTDTLFAIGATRVTCTGVDTRGQSNSCSFTVTVTPPPTISLTQFVAFGDSITAGEITVAGEGGFHTLQLIPSLSYPTDLRDSLQARYSSQQIQVANEGVKGELTSMGVARLPGVLQRGYQVLLLDEGANDISNASDAQVLAALANVRTMVRFAKGRGVRVFLGTMPPENPFTCINPCRAGGYAQLQSYNLGLAAIAASEGVALVDVFTAFHGDTTTLIGPDGLHPTAEGYRVMAGAFFDAIKTALEIPATTTVTPSWLRTPSASIPSRKK